MFTLRNYQLKLKSGIYQSWQSGNRNVCAVSPTGSGKTVTMSSIASDMTESGVAIAHRAELVGQISLTLAVMGVEHRIIGSSNTVRFCIQQQIIELGRHYVNQSEHTKVTVAAVDTLKSRADKMTQWASRQRWWVIDEAHHVLQSNKWGAAVDMFPNAFGIGFTATPLRADRKALHASQGGVFHDLVVGPSMRQLINDGALCDYRIFVPPQSFFMDKADVGATGDYKATILRANAHKSKIVGDIVGHYQKLAGGKRGITFTVDVAQAVELEQAFNKAGVPAMAISAKSGDAVRAEAVRKFRNGKILQLINVDLFGEGFDVPAVEVVSMGRPTMSYGLYVQQFGRALRVLKDKERGLIIDHVGNVKAHGLPDAPREWSLYAPERGKRNMAEQNVMPMTSCVKCFYGYEAFHSKCPYCGHKPEPAGRKLPEQVQGDLIELDPQSLAELRGEVEATDKRLANPAIPHNADRLTTLGIKKRANERMSEQLELREAIAEWAGVYHHRGQSDSEIHRRFWFRFGTDVMTAQTIDRASAEKLKNSIKEDIVFLNDQSRGH